MKLYTYRLKFGGTGAFDKNTGEPQNRVIAFELNGDASITVLSMSSSKDTDRELSVAAGSKDNSIGTISALGAELTATTINYVGEATTIYIWSPSSGVNIYRIMVSDGSSTKIQNIENSAVVSSQYYNLSGVNVGSDFNSLSNGVYIKVDTFENGSKSSSKVVKN